MAAFFVVDNTPTLNVSANVYQTAAGYIRAPHGAGLSRQLMIFMDGLGHRLAQTVSNLPLGDFTVDYMGHPYTPVTVVVKGESGENSTIDSHCQVF